MWVLHLVFVALINVNAWANTDKSIQGIDLARACRSDVAADQSLCRGFLDGFTFGSQMNVGSEFIGQWRYGGQSWCFPREIDKDSVRQTLLEFAQKNMGLLHFPAAVVLANALTVAFPCKPR